jgi:hypothetical protein
LVILLMKRISQFQTTNQIMKKTVKMKLMGKVFHVSIIHILKISIAILMIYRYFHYKDICLYMYNVSSVGSPTIGDEAGFSWLLHEILLSLVSKCCGFTYANAFTILGLVSIICLTTYKC